MPGVMFGVLAISSGRDALLSAVGRQLAEEARSGADLMSRTIERQTTALQTLAHQDLMREIHIGDLDKRISALLVTVREGEGAIVELRVADAAGRVVAATEPARVGTTEAASPPEERSGPARLRGPWRVDGKAALEISVPVPDPDRPGETVGRLTALYDWRSETAELTQLRQNLEELGLDVSVLVVDPAGRVIGAASRQGDPTGTDLRAAGWTLAATGLLSPRAGYVVDRGARALVGHGELRAGGPPWRVLVAQPLSAALAPVRSLTRNLALALAAVLALALVLAAWIASRVAQPLRDLTRAAEGIARGETSVPLVASRSRDEVGRLTETFNRMSADLRRAQDEVLEAAKFAFVGELAAGVAHEVRTSLGVLRSSSQLLQPTLAERGGEGAELVGIMLEEIDHLDGVVNQLLDLGRPRPLAIEPTGLSHVLARAADFAEPQARAAGVTIVRLEPGVDPIALCDEEQIYQVALNLIVNAVQMLPRGGTVRLAIAPPKQGTVGFEVRDDGPGIAPDQLPKIFLPFFSRREGGVGLGLTLVRRIVQDHKGRLEVESELGEGSTFRVELPKAFEEQA